MASGNVIAIDTIVEAWIAKSCDGYDLEVWNFRRFVFGIRTLYAFLIHCTFLYAICVGKEVGEGKYHSWHDRVGFSFSPFFFRSSDFIVAGGEEARRPFVDVETL